MRTKVWALLMVVGLVAGLMMPEKGRGQSPLVPLGRPFTMASGFSQPAKNVPIDTSNSIVPMPGQRVGITMPNFRKLMSFPNFNITRGVSPLPTASTFSSASYPNALNPFTSTKK